MQMGSGHEKLVRAPVTEAICELRVVGTKPFSLLPGAMATALHEDFPASQETEAARVVGLLNLPPEAGFIVTHQFRSLDGKRLVQLGPGGISVNASAYPGFEAFKESIGRVFNTFTEIVDAQSVTRIGLRYINGLPLDSQLLASLTATVRWPPLDGGKVQSIAARTVLGYEEPPGTLAVAISAPHSLGTLLDLDFFTEPKIEMTLSEILGWIDSAHERVYDAFRSMTSPALFETLKG
jgi:uncharacterized protein (TIGR04255 family)